MLTQRLVTRYAKYKALQNMLEAWLKDARSGIVEALRKGIKCPDKGPYLLELGEAEVRISWKDEFRKWLIVRSGMSEQEAEVQLVSIATQQGRGFDVRLLCKPNPNYGRKVEIRLPAA